MCFYQVNDSGKHNMTQEAILSTTFLINQLSWGHGQTHNIKFKTQTGPLDWNVVVMCITKYFCLQIIKWKQNELL